LQYFGRHAVRGGVAQAVQPIQGSDQLWVRLPLHGAGSQQLAPRLAVQKSRDAIVQLLGNAHDDDISGDARGRDARRHLEERVPGMHPDANDAQRLVALKIVLAAQVEVILL